MKSQTLPSFWETYARLGKSLRTRARKTFELWSENPFHPSLHFKCINAQENIWAVRVSLGYRALGVMEADTVTWFWVGSHTEYEKYFG